MKPTREEAIAAAGRDLAASDLAQANMTPREQAEAAWTPTSPYTVDELEERIRARRARPAAPGRSADDASSEP